MVKQHCTCEITFTGAVVLDRDRFESGLNEMVHVLQPHTIIVYGSANYKCFAGELLIGKHLVSGMSVDEIAEKCGVSHKVAEVQRNIFLGEG